MELLESLTASLGQVLSAKGAYAPDRLKKDLAGGALVDRVRAARMYVGGAAPEADVVVADVPRAPPPPVIQTTPIAMPIDPATYRNARSPSNPNGSLLPLYAFRELVDPVPTFTRYYSPGPVPTESAYRNLLAGAFVPDAASSFTREVLANAQQQFAAGALPPLDGTPTSSWHPVYADPPNWFDVNVTQYQPLTLATGGLPSKSSFTVLQGGASVAAWRIAGGNEAPEALDPATQILSASLRYLMVSISRPWLDFTLFRLNNWALGGQGAGFYSSGDVTANDGLMPLIPTAIILGTNASITARFGPQDRALLKSLVESGTDIALGPVPLRIQALSALDTAADGTVTLGSSLPFIVAWVSALVPLAPAMKDPRAS